MIKSAYKEQDEVEDRVLQMVTKREGKERSGGMSSQIHSSFHRQNIQNPFYAQAMRESA